MFIICLEELKKYSVFLYGMNSSTCFKAFQVLQRKLLGLHSLTLFYSVSYDIHKVTSVCGTWIPDHPQVTPPNTAHTSGCSSSGTTQVFPKTKRLLETRGDGIRHGSLVVQNHKF